MIINILVFASNNFNKTLDEIKDKLGFNLIPHDTKSYSNQNYHILLVDNEFLLKQKMSDFINFEKFKLPVLLVTNSQAKVKKKFFFDDQVYFPFNILELRRKINNLIASHKFNDNSSVNIKSYTIDKNLKTITKNNITVSLTEKEVNLLVLLNEENKPLNKKFILKKVWQYSIDADTHTVETHIYRLRKKVFEKFGDERFINILKEGYSF